MASEGGISNAESSASSAFTLKSGMSHLLSLDKFMIRLLDENDDPIADTECTCTFPDGTSKKKVSDAEGWITVTRLSSYEYVDLQIAGSDEVEDRRVYFISALKQDDPLETVGRLLENMGYRDDGNDCEKLLDDFRESCSLDLKNTGIPELIEIINDRYKVFVQDTEMQPDESPSDADEAGDRT